MKPHLRLTNGFWVVCGSAPGNEDEAQARRLAYKYARAQNEKRLGFRRTFGPFDNKSIRRVVPKKPHIVFVMGLWRVSAEFPSDRKHVPKRWRLAHDAIRPHNERILDKAWNRT